MTEQIPPLGVSDAVASLDAVDVSPEAIAALVARGASALGNSANRGEALPDALPLLVGITHDLRSPLSSMLVLIERMRAGHAGPLTPLQERQLGLLYSATFGVAALTNDALDVARGTARELRTQPPVPFSVGDLWRGVRGLVQPIAEEKHLTLRWGGLAHDRRVGHAAALHRVLLNLVTNALKFTASGSVTVSAEEAGEGRVRFAVADTGDGLPAALRAQLRRSGEDESLPTLSSSGLGLTMCQQMLGAIGSRLEDWSETGRPGATLGFLVSLPRA